MDVCKLYLLPEQKTALDKGFADCFGMAPERYFSAPGRTEIGGNHTDHQRGRVLAAAVNLDTNAAVRVNGSNLIRIQSKGYPMCQVDIRELTPVDAEINSTPALVRGVAARFAQLGCEVKGFDAYCESTVLPGSGLSSSAAYEVLIGTIINHLFFDGKVSQPEVAMIGQYAENVFFGKPCGLMDQMASAVGNLVNIDFFDKENPVIHPVSFDFASCGHALCIIDSGADHADLTDEYAAIPGEIKAVAAHFGKPVLRGLTEEQIISNAAALRKKCGDRAILRALHFIRENKRVERMLEALANGNTNEFLSIIKESGNSSANLLQNYYTPKAPAEQGITLACAIASEILGDDGAYRVHGGGFAGTMQAFVPHDRMNAFRETMESVFGKGAVTELSVRPLGACAVYHG